MVLELYICAADRRQPANPNDRSVSSLCVMPPSGGSSPSSPSSDADSDYELASIGSEPKSYELPDENETLEELAAANGQQLEFPAGVPAEVIRSVEERLKQLPFETPGCTLPLVYPRADPTSALYLVYRKEISDMERVEFVVVASPPWPASTPKTIGPSMAITVEKSL